MGLLVFWDKQSSVNQAMVHDISSVLFTLISIAFGKTYPSTPLGATSIFCMLVLFFRLLLILLNYGELLGFSLFLTWPG